MTLSTSAIPRYDVNARERDRSVREQTQIRDFARGKKERTEKALEERLNNLLKITDVSGENNRDGLHGLKFIEGIFLLS